MPTKLPPCPRYLAIDILCRWQQAAQSIDPLLAEQLLSLADSRDRKLLKALIFGVLRQRGTIDWAIGYLSSTPLAKLTPVVHEALRVGAYQILFMDRVPLAAAVHSTVAAVKALGQPRWLAGFVNGLLRNLGRQRQELLRLINTTTLGPVSRCNHPNWLLKRWRKRYGRAGMAAICQSNSQPAKLTLRINTAQVTVADFWAALAERGITAEPGQFFPETVTLTDTELVSELPGYNEGWFFVQDEFAQALVLLILPCPPGNWLDACAGVGGKTAILAGLSPTTIQLVAVEPNPYRQQTLAENMARLRIEGVLTFAGKLAEYAADHPGEFAAILIDAPCSGLGVTGRHPDIRWQREEAGLMAYQAKQLTILREAVPLLAPGGVLVFATCSTEPEEGPEAIAKFMAEFPEFVIEDASGCLPPSARCLLDEAGCLTTIPGRFGSDGFFAARLRRRSSPPTVPPPKP